MQAKEDELLTLLEELSLISEKDEAALLNMRAQKKISFHLKAEKYLDETGDQSLEFDQLGSAIFLLEKALTTSAEQRQKATIHNNLGYALFLRGEFEQALEHYNKALRLNRYFAEAQQNRERCLPLLKQTKRLLNLNKGR